MSTIKVDTVRPVTADASLTLQGDSSGSGVTGLTIDSSGVINTTTAKATNIQATSGQSLTIKDEDGNAAITIGTDNTAAGYLSLNFGSYHGASGGAGSGTLSANTLDDFEIGSFTPVFADAASSGNESSSTLSGKYTKIGNVVYFVVSIFNLSTVGLTAGNSSYITGFPFSNNSGFNAYSIPWTDSLNYDGYPMFVLIGNTTYGFFVNCRDSNTDTNVLVSAFTSGTSDFYINGFYYVS